MDPSSLIVAILLLVIALLILGYMGRMLLAPILSALPKNAVSKYQLDQGRARKAKKNAALENADSRNFGCRVPDSLRTV